MAARDNDSVGVSTSSASSENSKADSGGGRGTSNGQMKNEPDTEIRDPIEDHEPVRHLISPEDGLHVFPSPGNESNHRADAEAEHNGTDVSPTSGDVLRLYDATASGGNSQEHVDHLENALQEYIAKNQKLKEGLKINSRPEDKEKQCGEVAQLSREHATDGESDVEDHQEQRTFVCSRPSTDLRVSQPITDHTPRDHSLKPLVVRQDVVDEENDGQEPGPTYSDHNMRVVTSYIHVSSGPIPAAPINDQILAREPSENDCVCCEVLSAPMNGQDADEQLFPGIHSAFLARHSQFEDLVLSVPMHCQVSTREPSENDCVRQEVSSDRIPQSAPAQSAPAQSAPAQSAPAQSAPDQSAPAQSTPAQSAPAQSAPVHGQVSTREPSENDCACQEVNNQTCGVLGTITPTNHTCCICLQDAFNGCQILPCSHKVHIECFIDRICQVGIHGGFICPSCGFVLLRRG